MVQNNNLIGIRYVQKSIPAVLVEIIIIGTVMHNGERSVQGGYRDHYSYRDPYPTAFEVSNYFTVVALTGSNNTVHSSVQQNTPLISSCCMPLASINNCATPAQTSMVAPFTGLKSTSAFPVTRKVNDITFISSNGGKVSCTERNINTTQLKWEFNLLGRPMDVCDFNRRDWINGSERRVALGFIKGGDSVVWSRKFSDQVCDRSALQHVLETIWGAKRMIIGRTIQETGINGVCDNKAIRIDVGMSKGCGDGLP
ncbi:hypothetical protein IFM89_016505 [Coptis chinensis]|uniref:Ribulose-1,5-bisphosphate carboxylase small subunit N-terminal domain-containing protein n=1 Tax=Coptis chinensis TaxID=261450 RepID=A0A835M538_9MAGN|nr:hypothetical protein IFM89_016505 [Coptis chinensis]